MTCTADYQCQQFNYVSTDPALPCHLYYYTPTHFDVRPNCMHYQPPGMITCSHICIPSYSRNFVHFLDKTIYLARSANLPNGLDILLSAISSYLFFYYEQSYLSIYWTDFHDFITKWKVGYLYEFSRSGLVIPIPQGTLPWQSI